MKKFHTSLTFTPKQLGLYLKGVEKWGKKEFEIAIALIYLKAYREIVPGSYFVAFPPKLKYEIELSKKQVLSNSEFRKYLHKYWEENTDIDVAIFRRSSNKFEELYKIPIQIKRFGLGAESDGNTESLIVFLENLTKYPKNENRLVILRENVSSVRPQIIVDWLNTNQFPFPEVIFIHQKPNFDIELFQLKPNNGTFSVKTVTKEQMVNP